MWLIASKMAANDAKSRYLWHFVLAGYSDSLPLNRRWKKLFIYLFIYWLRWVFIAAYGLSLVAASRDYFSLRCTGSRAQGQQLWPTGLVALQHVGSSRARAQNHVPCTGRQILSHCATREIPEGEKIDGYHLQDYISKILCLPSYSSFLTLLKL